MKTKSTTTSTTTAQQKQRNWITVCEADAEFALFLAKKTLSKEQIEGMDEDQFQETKSQYLAFFKEHLGLPASA